MLRQLRIGIIFLVLFTVLTGIIYPLVVTGIAQTAFPHQANGSLIVKMERCWLRVDRSALQRPQIFLGQTLSDGIIPV